MRPLKNNSFTDRQATSAEAKKALLAKLRPKPHVVDPDIEARKTAKEAELAAIRQARQAEREAKRYASAKAEAERASLEAELQEANELELRATQKAARDARYAARKQRRK